MSEQSTGSKLKQLAAHAALTLPVFYGANMIGAGVEDARIGHGQDLAIQKNLRTVETALREAGKAPDQIANNRTVKSLERADKLWKQLEDKGKNKEEEGGGLVLGTQIVGGMISYLKKRKEKGSEHEKGGTETSARR